MPDNTNTPYFVGIDVGTSKTRCVVGTINEEGTPEIIGHSEHKSLGMRRGVVIHSDEIAESIIHAVNEVEKLSGRSVSSATVNINGSHVEGIDSHGVIAISAANREVQEEDRVRVEEAASVMKMPANREIIQVFPKEYSLDGQGGIKDPIGMQGVRLEVDTHIVTASVPNVKNLEQAFESASLVIKHKTISSLAAAEAVLTRQQRESGTAIVDIGAGTTNIIVVEDGEVQHVAVIPVGGVHVTNDLAIGLKVDLDLAEELKIQHASIIKPSRTTASIKFNGEQQTFDMSEVHMIVEARMEELLELVNKELKKINKAKKLPGGIVFSGGGSKLAGLDESARDILDLPARVAEVLPVSGLSDISKDISYATPIGLMLLDMLLDGQSSTQTTAYNSTLNSVAKLFSRIRRKK